MERSEYEDYLEFKEFQRMRQEDNSPIVGSLATASAKRPEPTPAPTGLSDPNQMSDNFSHDFDALWYQGRI